MTRCRPIPGPGSGLRPCRLPPRPRHATGEVFGHDPFMSATTVAAITTRADDMREAARAGKRFAAAGGAPRHRHRSRRSHHGRRTRWSHWEPEPSARPRPAPAPQGHQAADGTASWPPRPRSAGPAARSSSTRATPCDFAAAHLHGCAERARRRPVRRARRDGGRARHRDPGDHSARRRAGGHHPARPYRLRHGGRPPGRARVRLPRHPRRGRPGEPTDGQRTPRGARPGKPARRTRRAQRE